MKRRETVALDEVFDVAVPLIKTLNELRATSRADFDDVAPAILFALAILFRSVRSVQASERRRRPTGDIVKRMHDAMTPAEKAQARRDVADLRSRGRRR